MRRQFAALLVILICKPVLADLATNGPGGIDATGLGLNGNAIVIGQAESGRSGRAGFDSMANSAAGTTPTAVLFQTSLDSANSQHITNHATLVAGIMIGQASVVQGALLYSSAIGGNADDVEIALTLNRLATISGGNGRAINLSFGRELGFFESPDGSSHATLFVDWSARQHDVLYVAAWANEDNDVDATPTDNFNGITVAASQQRSGGSVWNGFGDTNGTNALPFNDSQNIHILAPGHNVLAQGLGSTVFTTTGTSFAAPSVTGTVALLQQYSDENIFTTNSRRHEVMKAVMMNSADKLSGVHGSGRTVCDAATGPCNDWTQSEAFNNTLVPLDDRMGAGHLNARRAVQQLAAGEHGPGNVPPIGWDYAPMSSLNSEYILNQPIGGYIAITLVWDRRVESTGFDTYNAGDQLTSFGWADLNLWLLTMDGTAVASSQSADTNFEHIFADVPSGNYKILVTLECCGLADDLNYALAWWHGEAPPIGAAGDFNGDGSVDAADYVVWRKNDGSSAGYDEWRTNFGNTYGSGSSTFGSVPEPSGLMLLTLAGALFAWRRSSR